MTAKQHSPETCLHRQLITNRQDSLLGESTRPASGSQRERIPTPLSNGMHAALGFQEINEAMGHSSCRNCWEGSPPKTSWAVDTTTRTASTAVQVKVRDSRPWTFRLPHLRGRSSSTRFFGRVLLIPEERGNQMHEHGFMISLPSRTSRSARCKFDDVRCL